MPDYDSGHHIEDEHRRAISLESKENTLELANPLHLKVDDAELIRWTNQRIEASEDFYKKKNIPARIKKNKDFLFGRQIDYGKLKNHQGRGYMDNIIYEGEGTIKPIALSQLPDMVVKPGSDEEESKEAAKNLSRLLNTDLKKRENRRALGIAFKHLPVYFKGVIKAFWNPESGKNGNYEFRVLHPDNVVMDHSATSNSADNMSFVAETLELSVKEVLMRFPDKRDELLEVIGFKDDMKDKKKEEKMASMIKPQEIWFTWYETVTDDEGKKKFERVEGTLWKYRTVLLGKMRNPYWDWQGEKRLFTYDLGQKRELTEDELRASLFGEETQEETIFHNHFEMPKKPYIFLGYDQWGEMPMDETSRIEQVISLQRNVNKRGLQITDMNSRARGKDVWSSEFLDKKDVENMDPSNPDEDVVGQGSVRDGHTHIPGITPQASLFQEQNSERQKGFAKLGANEAVRGEKVSDVATTNQILREQNFGKIDDLVEDTINYAAEQMSGWAMQFIKLFYTADHMRRLLGADGETTFVKVNRDLVEDGMEVIVSASGVDKVQRKRFAMENAKLGLIDPLTYFVDTDQSDPKGRADKLLLFKLEPMQYYQQFVKGLDVKKQAEALNPPEQQPQGLPQGVPVGAQPTQAGQQPQQALPQGGGGEGFGNMMGRF